MIGNSLSSQRTEENSITTGTEYNIPTLLDFNPRTTPAGHASLELETTRNQEHESDLCETRPNAQATLLEQWFPFRELSLIAEADKRAKDPVYSAHRWWARRPPGVIRGLLLGLALPPSTSRKRFWQAFTESADSLKGKTVLDLFAGGGTTLVETSRLGGIALGADVDPLAVTIVQHELERPPIQEVTQAGEALLSYVESEAGHLYAPSFKAWTPIHYFYLHFVTCPCCSTKSHLYKNLIIARHVGKHGAVVRAAALHAFCPSCLKIHALQTAERQELRKLEKITFPLSSSIFRPS